MKKIIPLILMALVLISVIWSVFVFIPQYEEKQKLKAEAEKVILETKDVLASSDRRVCSYYVRTGRCYVTIHSKDEEITMAIASSVNNFTFGYFGKKFPFTMTALGETGYKSKTFIPGKHTDCKKSEAECKKERFPGPKVSELKFKAPKLPDGEILVIRMDFKS